MTLIEFIERNYGTNEVVIGKRVAHCSEPSRLDNVIDVTERESVCSGKSHPYVARMRVAAQIRGVNDAKVRQSLAIRLEDLMRSVGRAIVGDDQLPGLAPLLCR
jgi:hypothetical protein